MIPLSEMPFSDLFDATLLQQWWYCLLSEENVSGVAAK
jgi:hypothetical protein